ncbi:MAG: DNA primase [Candidatus Latescibacterota bacterium]
MPLISDELKQRIREATDIVELVSEHVPLRKRGGSNYFGLCPFHKEDTPSFSVNTERQIYHCFGCGAGGDAFRFVQEVDRVSFVEAASYLAQRAGIPLPDPSRAPSQDQEEDLIYRANELAQKYFQHMLCSDPQGQKGRDYLQQRGLAPQTIERFGLGYAPPGWDGLLAVARRRQVSGAVLERAGLAVPRASGQGHYDRFRDRVVFPITSPSGRTIAFGARALEPGQEPKYLNSPETSIYRKGAALYGLAHSREALRRRQQAVVVEGYMDLLTLFQAGICQVVAPAGTALTEEQCRLLGRYVHQVVLLFDGDAAGSAAAARAVEALLGTALEARVASLPGGHDPDTYVREAGAQALVDLLDHAAPALEYYLEHLRSRLDLGTVGGKVQAMEALKPLILRCADPVRRDLLIRQAAQSLGVDEQAVRQQLRQELRRMRRPSSQGEPPGTGPLSEPGQPERAFLGLLLSYPRYIAPTADRLAPEAFPHPLSQELARFLFARAAAQLSVEPSLLISEIADRRLGQFAAACAMQGLDESHVEEQWEQSVATFQRQVLARRIDATRQALRQAQAKGDAGAVEQLHAQHAALVRQRQALAAAQSP